MNKKEYIKPEMEQMVMESQQIMTTSPGTAPGFGEGDGYADDSTPLSTGRRGSWGDLWAEEE